MNILRSLVLATLWALPGLHAQDAEQVTPLLKKLKSDGLYERADAMAELQTSLDLRIPEACLQVLPKEGDSTRRKAVRAIGSRWHQIPQERRPAFHAALKAQLESDSQGIVNMASRGIALLSREYAGPMVSISANKRWVIYERRGLPCLIDTTTMTEELLGFPSEPRMVCTYGNDELAPTVKWHPAKEMVGLEIVTFRNSGAAWVWAHGKGLRKITHEELTALFEGAAPSVRVFGAKISGWTNDDLDLKMDYRAWVGDVGTNHDVLVRWHSTTDKLSVVSDVVTK